MLVDQFAVHVSRATSVRYHDPLGNDTHRHVLEDAEAVPLDRLVLEEAACKGRRSPTAALALSCRFVAALLFIESSSIFAGPRPPASLPDDTLAVATAHAWPRQAVALHFYVACHAHPERHADRFSWHHEQRQLE